MADTITVRNGTGDLESRLAGPTPTPGLWVVADTSGEWSLTHERSGCAIAWFTNPEAALAAAIDLDGLFDWTRSADDMLAEVPLRRFYRIVRRYDGSGGHNQAGPDDRTDLPGVAR